MGPIDRVIIGGIFIVASLLAYLGYAQLKWVLTDTGIYFLFALGCFYWFSAAYITKKLRDQRRFKERENSRVGQFSFKNVRK
mgnify:CR=1 FL=1